MLICQMKTLRVILKEKGVNQKIVADALGVDVTSIRRYDDLQKRSVEEVIKISEATGIDFTELTGINIGELTNISDNKGNINTGAVGGDNLNNSRGVYNRGSISGSVSTGDNHTSINGGVSVGNDSTSKLSDYEQEIILLKEKVLHLEEMLKEKERFIQVLLANK